MSPASSSNPPPPAAISAISAVVGVLALGVLFQGLSAGRFVENIGAHKHWIDAHNGVGGLVLLLAVATTVIAFTLWRGKDGFQVVAGESIALLVLVVAEFAIGQSVSKHVGLLIVHIPVALLIFGLSTHMSSYVANVRRRQ